jgi:hypothetical protein
MLDLMNFTRQQQQQQQQQQSRFPPAMHNNFHHPDHQHSSLSQAVLPSPQVCITIAQTGLMKVSVAIRWALQNYKTFEDIAPSCLFYQLHFLLTGLYRNDTNWIDDKLCNDSETCE